MPSDNLRGLLAIGDPHLSGRVPGFRRDDYPRTILRKLSWCLGHAAENRLLPVLLGDLFHLPRDNPNWLLGELLAILPAATPCVYGNHDCHENELSEHDSFDVLVRAGKLRILSTEAPWTGRMNGRDVVVGGSSYREALPERFDPPAGLAGPLVIWLAHHDLAVPGYEEQGYRRPSDIDGVDLIINGHIHRRLEVCDRGTTRWVTPGNIARVSRGDATRQHTPAALRVSVDESGDGPSLDWIPVPHEPFEEVFHEEILTESAAEAASVFVQGLAELEARKTAAGAGLKQFLEANMGQFAPAVAQEVMRLAQEVTTDDER